MSNNNSSDNTIIVPINVQAICIGEEDSKQPYFIKRNADFSLLPYRDGNNTHNTYANISEHIMNNPFDSDRHALPQGIHLHWALPDAMTHATINKTIKKETFTTHFGVEEGATIWTTLTSLKHKWLILVNGSTDEAYFNNLSLLTTNEQKLGDLETKRLDIVSFLDTQQMKFLNVPNRWLITRISDGKYSKSWVVESDFLSAEDYVNGVKKQNTTVPYTSGKSPKPYRYLGEDFDYSNWEPNGDQPENTDSKEYYPNLTAIGYGDMEFAGYYPNCNSVFGFHDDFSDQENDFSVQDHSITYQVTGWYSNLKGFNKDPFNKSSDTKVLLDAFNWKLDSASHIERSLYSGTVADINWNSKTDYLKSGGEPNDVKISFAIKEEEALSTLTTDSHHQLFLTAWQMGIENQLDSPDGLIKAEKSSHTSRFQKHEGGFLLDVIDAGTTKNPTSPNNDKELPLGVLEVLAQINQEKENYNKLSDKIISIRERVFSDWCKYLVQKYDSTYFKDSNNPSESQVKISTDAIRKFIESTDLTILDSLLKEFEKATSDIQMKHKNLVHAVEKVNAKLNKKYTISQTPSPSYYQGNDPVVLFEDKGGEGWQYAGNRNDMDAAALPCRLSTEVLKGPTDNLKLPAKEGFELYDVMNQLINEGYILRNGLSSVHDYDIGTPPPSIAVVTYPKNKNPWLVMQLHWKVYFSGLEKGGENNSYTAGYISENFDLTSDSTELKIKAELLTPDAKHFDLEQTLKGKCILTPHVKENVKSQIDRSLQEYSDSGELTSRLQAVKKRLEETKDNILAQTLTGFNDALVMNQQSLQVQVDDPLAAVFDRSFANKVKNAVAEENTTSPLPINQYHPIHAGLIKVEEMRIVDCFGRYQDMDVSNVSYATDLQLKNPLIKYSAMLPPRITQPARVLFEYLNADPKDDLPERIVYSGENPICGWVMLNILENAFMVYNSDGAALGSLRLAMDANDTSPIIWQTAPGLKMSEIENPTMEEVLVDANSYLAKLVTSLVKNKKADFFQSFIKSIKEAQKWISRKSYHQDMGMGALFGEPIALVRANIDLQLQGLPEMDESWDALKADMQSTNRERSTSDFMHVKFSAQVGTFDRLNDGLYGFFVQDREDESETFETYYTSGGTLLNDGIKANTKVQLTASDEDLTTLYMLVAPGNPVHLNMSVLPEQKAEIPLKYAEDAMNNISSTFLTAPLLVNADALRVPLSQQKGMEWSFIEKIDDEGKTWKTTDDVLDVSNEAVYTTSKRKLVEGWLKLSKE